MTMFLIEKDGERQCVASLEGYDGWSVVAEPARKLKEDEEWDAATGKWKLNPERKAKRERDAIARNPLAMLSRIEQLEAEVAALKEKIK